MARQGGEGGQGSHGASCPGPGSSQNIYAARLRERSGCGGDLWSYSSPMRLLYKWRAFKPCLPIPLFSFLTFSFAMPVSAGHSCAEVCRALRDIMRDDASAVTAQALVFSFGEEEAMWKVARGGHADVARALLCLHPVANSPPLQPPSSNDYTIGIQEVEVTCLARPSCSANALWKNVDGSGVFIREGPQIGSAGPGGPLTGHRLAHLQILPIGCPGGGQTPLHVASERGRLGVVKALLEAGADRGHQDQFRRTPLHSAAFGNHPESLAALLDHHHHLGKPSSSSPSAGRTSISLSAGLDVLSIADAGGGGVTSTRSRKELDDLKFQNEEDEERKYQAAFVNRCKTNDETALYTAASRGSVASVRLLLARDADPNLCNASGMGPMHVAADLGQVEVIVALLEDGRASRDCRDVHGATPVEDASRWNYPVRSPRHAAIVALLDSH